MILEARACLTFRAHLRTTRSTGDYAEALTPTQTVNEILTRAQGEARIELRNT
jgi:hypothetical protein